MIKEIIFTIVLAIVSTTLTLIQNKITEIRVKVINGIRIMEGVGTYKTSTNAMMLEINEEVPFKQTVLSNAIKLALIDALK